MADEEELIEACPSCDIGGKVSRRVGRQPSQYLGDPTKEYRCWHCGACFDEPVRRPAMGNRQGGKRVVSDEQLEAARRALGISTDGVGADG